MNKHVLVCFDVIKMLLALLITWETLRTLPTQSEIIPFVDEFGLRQKYGQWDYKKGSGNKHYSCHVPISEEVSKSLQRCLKRNSPADRWATTLHTSCKYENDLPPFCHISRQLEQPAASVTVVLRFWACSKMHGYRGNYDDRLCITLE